MHILLPPSETKRPGGAVAANRSALSHEAALGAARAQIRSALDDLMRDHDVAAAALKLGVRSRDELLHNTRLDAGECLPAIERYTGVLFDALDVETLDAAARDWLNTHVSVQSALFGLVSAATPISAYRLSGSTRLPALPAPLKTVWSDAHRAIDWSALGWVLDLRSKDYVALAPLTSAEGAFVEVMQRDADGTVRSLNHFNKAAKGRLVRRLAQQQPHIANAEQMCDWARTQRIEAEVSADGARIALIFAADE